MKRLGLGFDDLREAKPDIVMLSLSSCGQNGPDSHFAGYAPLFGAWGGLGWMSGYSDGPPMEMRHVMDHSAGVHAALATMAALHQRRRTGQAQHVDLAAREVASAMIGDALLMASLGATPRAPRQRRPGRWRRTACMPLRSPTAGSRSRCATTPQWQALVGVLGQGGTDPRFATAQGRLHHREELDQLLTQWLAACNADETAERLQQAGVCAHVSWNMQDIASDQHLRERGAVTEVSAPDIPKRLAVGAPARFARTDDVGIRRLTPALGQDEDYVFGELLGLDSAQRADLQTREVIL